MTPLDTHTNIDDMTPTAKLHISSLGKWMRFVAIVFLIFIALSILNSLYTYATIGQSGLFDMMEIPSSALILYAMVSIALLALQLYVGIQMYQSAEGFTSYANTQNPQMLEKAFEKNRVMWLVFGILTIISIVMIVIVMIFMARFLPIIMSGALG